MLKRNFRFLFIQAFVLLFFFSIGRSIFLTYYWDLYSQFNFSELSYSMLHGVRFDLVVIFKTFGILFLMLFLLGNYAKGKFFNRIYILCSSIFILFYLSIFFADLGYFGFIQRHISFDLILVLNELSGATKQVLNNYKLLLVFGLSLVVCILFFWSRFCLKYLNSSKRISRSSTTQQILLFPLIFFIIILCARGGWQKHVSIEDEAFKGTSPLLGHLTTSAPYSVLLLLEKKSVKPLHFMPETSAKLLAQKLLFGSKDKFLNKNFPFYRQYTSTEKRNNLNVVLIVLESWPAIFSSSFTKGVKTETPNLDQLAKKGISFTRYWGTGIYTVHGFTAMMASLPALPNSSIISGSLIGTKYRALPAIMKEAGYDTLFVQAYGKGSSNIDQFMSSSQTKKIITQEDFSEYKSKSDVWGIWDEYTFQRFEKELDQLTPPFFGVVHTSTTHSPYDLPNKKWNRKGKDSFQNALHYSDWALGEFFKKVKKKKYFKNTLFVITSDHIAHTAGSGEENVGRIPLVFYTPGGQLPHQVKLVTGSQTDLLPTILDLLNLTAKHSAMGRSLFEKKKGEGIAIFNRGKYLYWLQNEKLTVFKDKAPTAYYDLNQKAQKLENIYPNLYPEKVTKNFKAFLQTANNSMFYNRVSP